VSFGTVRVVAEIVGADQPLLLGGERDDQDRAAGALARRLDRARAISRIIDVPIALSIAPL
jgi:hypothetical protein